MSSSINHDLPISEGKYLALVCVAPKALQGLANEINSDNESKATPTFLCE